MNKETNMNLKKAMRNLDQQREWLGVEWVELFALLQEEPSEFSDITLRSFEIYELTRLDDRLRSTRSMHEDV
jgi:hypothetical protein